MTNKSFNINDPKWTAYALGELKAFEREAVDAELKINEEAQKFLNELYETRLWMQGALKKEPLLKLTHEQRKRIKGGAATRDSWYRSWKLQLGFALAACAALVLVIKTPDVTVLRNPSVSESPNQNQIKVAQAPELPSPSDLATEERREVGSKLRMSSPKAASKRPERMVKLEESQAGYARLGKEALSPNFIQRSTDTIAGLMAAGESGESRLEVFEDASSRSHPQVMPSTQQSFNTEAYDRIVDNDFRKVLDHPLSTFSVDVDTASYANVRRFLKQKMLPPKDAVRIEELVNYFTYNYSGPTGEHPFAVHMETASAPWKTDHRLVRIGLKGKEIPPSSRPAANLVFLVDVSGSMEPANKLPLLKKSMKMLVNNLSNKDRVAIVVYAGSSGLVLPSTTSDKKGVILGALENLRAGGSTNGGEGIVLAYKVASENFIKSGINRVILATDGDFNVGVTSQGDLIRLIEEKAKSGVFLSVLGFGMGNYKDSMLEKLADKGNGNYAYIDSDQEAKKVLMEQMGGTLMTIAKDVKIQIEFNPQQVAAYRLIGYENRILANEDFNNDAKDAGEIGAGHTVTALYEVILPGGDVPSPSVDPLKYQKKPENLSASKETKEMFTVKLRYKKPNENKSTLLSLPFTDSGQAYSNATADFKFAAAVASFGMLLRDSPHKGNVTFDGALELAREGKGSDKEGYRAEFIQLVEEAKTISKP